MKEYIVIYHATTEYPTKSYRVLAECLKLDIDIFHFYADKEMQDLTHVFARPTAVILSPPKDSK